MFKTILTAILIITVSYQLDCSVTLEKDDADLFFTENLVQTPASSVYYSSNSIEACQYTYTPLLNTGCLTHSLVWEEEPSIDVTFTSTQPGIDQLPTYLRVLQNTYELVEWNLTETDIADHCTANECKFTSKWYDWRITFREHHFNLNMFETVSTHTIDLNVNWVVENLGCSGNCQNLTGAWTSLYICSDNSCSTSVQNNQVLERTMGDNITCVVIIDIAELAAGHTLTLETMTFADASGNEVTVYSSETQQLGQYILAINLPFPCLACILTIESRRTVWTGRRRMMTEERLLQGNTDIDAVNLDLSVNQAGTAASGFNWLLIVLLLITFLVLICCYMFATKKKEKKGQEVNPKSKQVVSNKH